MRHFADFQLLWKYFDACPYLIICDQFFLNDLHGVETPGLFEFHHENLSVRSTSNDSNEVKVGNRNGLAVRRLLSGLNGRNFRRGLVWKFTKYVIIKLCNCNNASSSDALFNNQLFDLFCRFWTQVCPFLFLSLCNTLGCHLFKLQNKRRRRREKSSPISGCKSYRKCNLKWNVE